MQIPDIGLHNTPLRMVILYENYELSNFIQIWTSSNVQSLMFSPKYK